MPTVERDIALNVLGRIEGYRASLAQLPGVTEREAAKSALKLQVEMAKAAKAQVKAQQQAAAASAKLYKDAMSAAMGYVSLQAIKSAARAVVGIRQELADLTNQMGDLSGMTGVSVQTLNAFRVAAEISGGSLSELEAGLKGLPKRIDDFRRGTGEALPALEALGFASSDGAAMLADMDGSVRTIVSRLQGVEDPGKRAALATQLFGEAGVRLSQVLGDRTLDEWMATAALGPDVSAGNVRAAQEWQASVTLLGEAWTGTKQRMIEALAIDDAMRVGAAWVAGFGTLVAEVLNRSLEQAARLLVAMKSAMTGDLKGALDMLRRTDPAKQWREMAEEVRGSMDALKGTQDALKANADAAGTVGTTLAQTTEDRKRDTAAIKLQTDALRAQSDVMRQSRDLHASMTEDLLDEEGKIQVAFQDRLEQIFDLAEAAREAGGVQLDISGLLYEAEQRRMRDLAELYRENARTQIEASEQAWAAQMERDAQARAAAEERAAAEVETFHEVLGSMSGLYRNAEALLMEAANNRAKSSKKAARQMVHMARGAAIFGVVMDTAAAVMRGYAMFGPPPSPLGVLAAVNAAAAGVAQGAAIAAQPMPTFFGGTSRIGGQTPGGTAGEVMVAAHRDEAVLNSMARRNLGDEVIDALNAGLEPFAALAGGGGAVVLDGRLVGQVMADRAGRGGDPLRKALVGNQPVGYRSPYGRN